MYQFVDYTDCNFFSNILYKIILHHKNLSSEIYVCCCLFVFFNIHIMIDYFFIKYFYYFLFSYFPPEFICAVYCLLLGNKHILILTVYCKTKLKFLSLETSHFSRQFTINYFHTNIKAISIN